MEVAYRCFPKPEAGARDDEFTAADAPRQKARRASDLFAIVNLVHGPGAGTMTSKTALKSASDRMIQTKPARFLSQGHKRPASSAPHVNDRWWCRIPTGKCS